MKTRKTIDIQHTGKGGPVRVKKSDLNENTTAADIAAEILARREYGPSGYCRILNLTSWAADGSTHTYEAFIGYSSNGGTTGHNITIYT